MENEPRNIRIIIADSEAIFRAGMSKIFANEPDLEVVAQSETLSHTLSTIAAIPADVVLFEAGLSLTPAEAISEVVTRALPGAKIILIAQRSSEHETVDFLRRGVRGILTRSVSPELLVRCVRKVSAGETWLDNQGVNWIIDAYRSQAQLAGGKHALRFSEKEMLIISGVTQGLKNKDIAAQVGTTEQVVKNYLRKIYDKLGVADRLELALYSMHRKLLDGYLPQSARNGGEPKVAARAADMTPDAGAAAAGVAEGPALEGTSEHSEKS